MASLSLVSCDWHTQHNRKESNYNGDLWWFSSHLEASYSESINIEQSRTAVGVRAAAASLPLDQVWGLCVCVYSSTPDRFISPRGGSYWFLQDLSIGAISEATNDVFLFCVVGS